MLCLLKPRNYQYRSPLILGWWMWIRLIIDIQRNTSYYLVGWTQYTQDFLFLFKYIMLIPLLWSVTPDLLYYFKIQTTILCVMWKSVKYPCYPKLPPATRILLLIAFTNFSFQFNRFARFWFNRFARFRFNRFANLAKKFHRVKNKWKKNKKTTTTKKELVMSSFFITYPSLWKLEESSEFDMEDHFLFDVLVRGDAALRCVGVVDLLLGVIWALSRGLVKDFSTLRVGVPRILGLLGNTELCAKIKFTVYLTLFEYKHNFLAHNRPKTYL